MNPCRAGVLAVAVACALGQPPAAAAVPTPLPALVLPVSVDVVLEPPASTPTAVLALSWTREGDAFVGSLDGGRFQVTLRLEGGGGATHPLAIEIRYREAAVVEREALRLSLPGALRVLGRNLEIAPLHGALRVDRGTPVLAIAPDVAVVGWRGISAARYQPAVAGGGATVVELILDDAAGHPFSVYERCLDRLPPDVAAGGSFSRLEHRLPRARRVRPAGSVVRAAAVIYTLAPGEPARPLVVERWPHGARAAVVFVDHADRTDPKALASVLGGTSDRAQAGWPRGGFLGHGIALTKTFFLRGGTGALADDAEARALADVIAAAGSEVACHSISPGRDRSDLVAAEIGRFALWRVVTWVDHEPYTNCEAISSRGTETGGPFGVADLLAGAGFRWVWAAGDAGAWGEPSLVDLFECEASGEASPAIYPLPSDDRLWVFRSSWFYDTPGRLASALSEHALDRLARGRGLFVAHTYLSASRSTTRSADHIRRLAVRAGPGGELILDPALETALTRLGARVGAGDLASLTWRDAGDRLRALGEIEVSYDGDGSARVVNRGATTVTGLTLASRDPLTTLAAEGVSGAAGRPGTVVLDLAAGATATIHARRAGAPVPLLSLRAREVRLR